MNLPEHSPSRASRNRYNGKVYKRLSIPEHPNGSGPQGMIDEHRYLAAKTLGKSLPPGSIVHHHNRGKSGGPLVICQDHQYHMLIHLRMRAYLATGDSQKRHCSVCKGWDDPSSMYEYEGAGLHYWYHRKCFQKQRRERKERLSCQ